MRLLAISDLHISDTDDPLYGSMLRLIRDELKAGDCLVLAGDVFDLFVGGKSVFIERYGAVLHELREASTRDVRIEYIEGNHDFHLERALRSIPSLKLHAHSARVEMGGKRFYLEHGDTIDRQDYGYRVLRGFFRSPLMKSLIAIMPGAWLDSIGQKSSDASRSHRPRLPQNLSADRLARLRTVFREHALKQLKAGNDFVILGHCHDLDEVRYNLSGRLAQYANVGYPRVHGVYLCFDSERPEEGLVRLPLK